MEPRKKVRSRIIAVALIAFGLMLAVTWWESDTAKFPVGIGNYIFTALGLPVWSRESTGYPIGVHYPTVIGLLFMWAGVAVLEPTMKKPRWLMIALAVLVVIALILH